MQKKIRTNRQVLICLLDQTNWLFLLSHLLAPSKDILVQSLFDTLKINNKETKSTSIDVTSVSPLLTFNTISTLI